MHPLAAVAGSGDGRLLGEADRILDDLLAPCARSASKRAASSLPAASRARRSRSIGSRVRRQCSTSSVLAVVRDLTGVVPVVAVGQRLDERRALAPGRPLARLEGRPVDGADVLPVDLNRRQTEARRPLRDRAVQRGRSFDERLDGVLVVLAERDQWKLLDGREVDGLPGPPRVRAALPEEADANLAGLAELRRERRAHRNPQRRTDDPVRPEVAEREVVQVHRPSAAAGAAGRAPPELRHHDTRRSCPWRARGGGDGADWRRCPSGSSARIAPTATASCPDAWWTLPGIWLPLNVSGSSDSSNSRITSIVSSHSLEVVDRDTVELDLDQLLRLNRRGELVIHGSSSRSPRSCPRPRR